ncbi:hypothetical protein B0F90DRAFT_756978 [Multifurca ochricompacta]|uniref:Uncharacterized protein n=1 Tax=Multifurca ochricompacta TaxID=376703 RepID=A0AAD4M9T8_9AGAM|nr:hypothetical protein B0F90DRAFT_756978 [Multifurca ochricompacta]
MKVFYLEDGSAGRLRTSWLLGSGSPELEDHLRVHIYVRVVGRLSAYNGINELKATHIRPVLDMHEPFFHCLEAMVALIYKEKSSASASPLIHLVPGEVSRSLLNERRSTQEMDEIENNLIVQETASHEGFDTTSRDFDRLTLTDQHSDGDPDESTFAQEHSLLQEQSQPPHFWSSLRQDPYSQLSSLQRTIILQIQNSDPFLLKSPDGVAIDYLFKNIVRLPSYSYSGVGEFEIR